MFSIDGLREKRDWCFSFFTKKWFDILFGLNILFFVTMYFAGAWRSMNNTGQEAVAYWNKYRWSYVISLTIILTIDLFGVLILLNGIIAAAMVPIAESLDLEGYGWEPSKFVTWTEVVLIAFLSFVVAGLICNINAHIFTDSKLHWFKMIVLIGLPIDVAGMIFLIYGYDLFVDGWPTKKQKSYVPMKNKSKKAN